jgi:ATP-dependent DNA ligase
MVYYAFDLLHLDGFDTRAAPLVERKRVLQSFLSEAGEAAPGGSTASTSRMARTSTREPGQWTLRASYRSALTRHTALVGANCGQGEVLEA